MSDESTASRIEQLVAEEHELRARGQADSPDTTALDEDRERLRAVEVELDMGGARLERATSCL